MWAIVINAADGGGLITVGVYVSGLQMWEIPGEGAGRTGEDMISGS